MSLSKVWRSDAGIQTAKSILNARLPEWVDGVRPWQLKAVVEILDGRDTLVITATSDGKTALFFLPLLVLQHLAKFPELFPTAARRPEKPLNLVIVPINGLEDDMVKELAKIGLNATALHAKAVQSAVENGRNLFEEIRKGEWPYICLSPEMLLSREFDKVLRDGTFQSNIFAVCVDEAHVINQWGNAFRLDYNLIGLLRARLPSWVVFIAVTATLAPGDPVTSVLTSLGYQRDNHYYVRRSSERTNVQFIRRTLTHGLSGFDFPDIAWVLTSGRKTIIYCETIELCTRVALYLFSLCAPGQNRLERIRVYTALCPQTEKEDTLRRLAEDVCCMIVIATIAFGMGINCKTVLDVISLGVPATLDDWYQKNGRAGRDPDTHARGIAYIQKSAIRTATKRVAGSKAAESRERALTEEAGDDNIDDGDNRHQDIVTLPPGNAEMDSLSGAEEPGTQTETIDTQESQEVDEIPVEETPASDRQVEKEGGKTLRSRKRKEEPEMELALAKMIVEEGCLVALGNQLYNNPSPSTITRCVEGHRTLHCSNCKVDEIPPLPPKKTRIPDIVDSSGKAVDISYPPISKALHTAAETRFLALRHEIQRSLPAHSVVNSPISSFLPPIFVTRILDRISFVKDTHTLATIIPNWKYLDSHAEKLLEIAEIVRKDYEKEVASNAEQLADKLAQQKHLAKLRKRNKAAKLKADAENDADLAEKLHQARLLKNLKAKIYRAKKKAEAAAAVRVAAQTEVRPLPVQEPILSHNDVSSHESALIDPEPMLDSRQPLNNVKNHTPIPRAVNTKRINENSPSKAVTLKRKPTDDAASTSKHPRNRPCTLRSTLEKR